MMSLIFICQFVLGVVFNPFFSRFNCVSVICVPLGDCLVSVSPCFTKQNPDDIGFFCVADKDFHFA